MHHEIALISTIVSERGTPSRCQIIQIRVIDPDISRGSKVLGSITFRRCWSEMLRPSNRRQTFVGSSWCSRPLSAWRSGR